MHNSFLMFKKNLQDAKGAGVCYEYLSSNITVPVSFEDLLRAQVVYSVSAFDKFLHDIIKIGMVQIFEGSRSPTPKYLSEPISIKTHSDLVTAFIPPREYVFEQAIVNKLKFVSYQDPDKVADGLSYIWAEKNKWKEISSGLGISDREAKTTLRLIANRRNSIVHEADIDPITNIKLSITKVESDNISSFLDCCGLQIYNKIFL